MRRSAPIDSIAMTSRIMSCAEGAQLLDKDDTVISDCRSYLLNLNIEEYFNDNFSLYNRINKEILNLSRKSHKAIYCKEIEHQL